MQQIPELNEIAKSTESAYKIIQNFKNGEYADEKDPNLCRIAIRAIRYHLGDALKAADDSQSQLGEV